MAAIRETLTLQDQFTPTLQRYAQRLQEAANAGNTNSKAVNGLARETRAYTNILNAQSAASRATERQARAETAAINKQIAMTKAAEQQIKSETSAINQQTAALKQQTAALKLQEQQQRLDNQAKKQATGELSKMTAAIKNLAAAYLSVQGVQKLLNVSDQMSQISGRLSLVAESFNEVNGTMVTTSALSQQIMQAANNSRGSYMDMASFVSKLGTLATGAFDNTDELVLFSEQIQKQMKLSGTSAAEASGAMLQLTQAMSSGVLRGEELNSLMEQMPMIAQTIAQYLGMSTGEMKNFASEGGVTAEVVKNAMLSAVDETNEKFESIPATWSDVGALMANNMLQTFQPLLSVVSAMAQWSADNIDTLIPAFYGLAAAVGAYAAMTVIAKIANDGLKATLLSNPIGWIALLIGIVVYYIYQWIQSVGGLKIAWLIATNEILTNADLLKIGFLSVWYSIQDGAANMKANVLMTAQGMINGVIGGINQMINKINSIFGTSYSTMAEWQGGTVAQIQAAMQAAEHANTLSEMSAEAKKAQMERRIEIAYARREAEEGSQDNVFTPDIPTIPAYSGMGAAAAQTADNTGKTAKAASSIAKSVDKSKEDIKSLVDIATKRFVNNVNVNSAAPVINMSVNATDSTPEGRKKLADTLRDILIEQRSSGSTVTVGRY